MRCKRGGQRARTGSGLAVTHIGEQSAAASGPGCVKTCRYFEAQKSDLPKRAIFDDRKQGKGQVTPENPEFDVSLSFSTTSVVKSRPGARPSRQVPVLN